jgi:hypothetical protein
VCVCGLQQLQRGLLLLLTKPINISVTGAQNFISFRTFLYDVSYLRLKRTGGFAICRIHIFAILNHHA